MASSGNTSHHAASASITSLPQKLNSTKCFLVFLTIVTFGATAVAQDAAPADTVTQDSTPPSTSASITVPAGTAMPLVLAISVQSRMIHRGDGIHAQIAVPITVGSQVAIPAGSFLQGKVDKLRRRGTRAEIQLQSASIIFPDGYIATLPGSLTIESEEGTAWLDAGTGTKVGAIIAPFSGLGIGAAIGSAAHTTQTTSLGGMTSTTNSVKGIGIGSLVGLGIGGVVSLALIAHSHQFYIETGAPLLMTTPEITLAQTQVDSANRAALVHPVSLPPRPAPVVIPSGPVSHGTCMTPGTPGTSPTIIPGAVGANGIPGPPTVIPGTPPTAGTPYPCP
jgi:hypothetical protein